MIIKDITAKKIKNSRNQDTIEVIVKTDLGNAMASAPSGASKSKKEVIDFPESVDSAVNFVNTLLNSEFKNFEFNSFDDLKQVENMIKNYDDTERMEKIGGNLVIAFEFALLQALSKGKIWKFINPETKTLPRPLGNCIGGGKHVDSNFKNEFQEYLLLSLDANSFSKAAKANLDIYDMLRNNFKHSKLTDEGALAMNLSTKEKL